MKTVLVTGGTCRIGRAISARLREAGWRVFASSHRVDAGADLVADLSEADGAERLHTAAVRLNGGAPLDALVNNAALFAGDAAKIRAVGFDAPRRLVALMAARARGRGAVVNVLDAQVLASEQPQWSRRAPAYVAAKRALAAETRAAARRYAATLTVNAVAPGPVLAPTVADDGNREKAGECPLGRPTPEAVADAVAWLLAAPFTSGLTIPIDGGQTLLL